MCKKLRIKSYIRLIIMTVAMVCIFNMGLRTNIEASEGAHRIDNALSMKYSTSISKSNEVINKDDIADVKLHFENNSGEDKVNLKFKLMVDGNSEVIGNAIKDINKISTDETIDITWSIKCSNGGSRLFIEVIEGKCNPLIIKAGGITVSGEGWFSGDSHTHSKYSDGSGTIKENLNELKQKGLDYITITDHENSSGWDDSQSEDLKDLIVVRGNEYSAKTGHAVIMNVNEDKPYASMDKKQLVDYIKQSTKNRGLIYAAHPYQEPPTWSGEDWNVGINGIEVWNGWWGARHKYNVDSFTQWDKMNKEGRHIYGIATTDAHSSENIGKTFTTAYLKDFSSDGIIDSYRKGHMYGSNGPIINFNIGSHIMGDDIEINGDNKLVKVTMKGLYHENLGKVKLIKNGEVIYSGDLKSNNFNIASWINVVPGDFLRMEVEGIDGNGLELSSEGFDSAPFAFSNPIFIVKKN